MVTPAWSRDNLQAARFPMKRRRFMTNALAVPAAPALMAQQQSSTSAPAPAAPQGRPMQTGQTMEVRKLDMSVAEEAGEAAAPRFFTAVQFATLRKLGGMLMPARKGLPGALEAEAAEFLDFLLGQSGAERKAVYTKGLDALEAEARKKFGKPFAQLEPAQAGTLLSPLRRAWTYDPPTDALARLLWAAKTDVRNATLNSKAYNAAAGAGTRRTGVSGLYWHELD